MKAKGKLKMEKRQRGAALVTVLLMSTLLLATGGTLVLVTAMSTRSTIDATSEMQAYYSAEAGLQDTLNVLRGNINPRGAMPNGSTITFRGAINLANSNVPGDAQPACRANDPTSICRLSGWLNYSYASDGNTPDRVALTQNYSPLNGLAYSVQISDPDETPLANGEPRRLLVRVRGYGPKGAEKRLELIVKRTNFDYAPPAMLMIRGADDCSPVNFTAGDSAAKDYTGHDNAPTGVILPAFGATCNGDKDIQLNADTKNTVVDPKSANIPLANLPSYLQSTDGVGGARDFLYGENGQIWTAKEQNPSRYFTSYDGAPTGFTFVDGDCILRDGGSGLLIVTGTLTLNGNPSFDGLVLVMGAGVVQRSGAGNGEFHGAMAVARFNRNGGPFLAPTFNTDGAGTSLMQYDSNALQRALNQSGPRVQGIHEY